MALKAKSRMFKVSAGTLELPLDVSSDDFDIEDPLPNSTTPRQKLNHFLNLLSVQSVIVTLVVMDTLLVLFLLLMELEVIQAPNVDVEPQPQLGSQMNASGLTPEPTDHVGKAERAMHIVQLTLLCLFVVEMILRVLSRGVDVVYDKWQVFDTLVVFVTFALYVALTAAVEGRKVTYSVGFIIILRLWRIGRIHYDMTQPVIQKARTLILAHRRAWKLTEEELKRSRQQALQEEEKVKVLKSKLRAMSMVLGQSGFSSNSPSFSGDTLTSEDSSRAGGSKNSSHSAAAQIHTAPSNTTAAAALRTLRSSSLPSAGIYGSYDVDSSVSLPGSPKSLSHYYHGPSHATHQQKMISHGSSGKIPDLVEHTQGADLCRDPSFKEPLTIEALALDRGQFKGHSALQRSERLQLYHIPHQPQRPNGGLTEQDNIFTVDRGASHLDPSVSQRWGHNGGPKYKKNPDRNSSDARLTRGHRERSVSANNLVEASNIFFTTSDSVHSDNSTLPRHRRDHLNSHLYPGDKGDRRQLLEVFSDGSNRHSASDFAFSNPSFSGLTEEELKEIARVSQVPFNQFGSISHLLQEGIPISEL